VLGRQEQVTPAESLEFATLCRYKRLYAAAARFYHQAFAAEPKWAQDLQSRNRYHAACAAALATAGKGGDTAKLDEKERVRWRAQAREWLQADLKLWAGNLGSSAPRAAAWEELTLQSWQQDPDLAGLRDEKALAQLPEAERAAWLQLWADVEKLLKKVAP
jgi:serine/threonine-protein kinase